MNEVSIIINGVRYDAVGSVKPCCNHCELYDICKGNSSQTVCGMLNIAYSKIFKKSDKKFEV